MKVLVLGASGMAGHVLTCSLMECGNEVTGFARKELSFCRTVCGDATDRKDLKRVLCDDEYDVVLNCIGVLNQAVDANPAAGIYLNSVLPHLLVELTKNMRTRIVHLSTDCVFSGVRSGNYTESSFRSADSVYGRSKALGEICDTKNLTIRTSIIGPDMRPEGIGLFNWFMRQSEKVTGYCGVLWTGVTTIELASAVMCALEQKIVGLYHLVNNEKISKYELLGLFNRMRAKPIKILESHEVRVDKSLINTRKDFSYQVPSYEEMVENMERWIRMHASFYPQYDLKGMAD